MLLDLHVKNLALIEKADIEFGEGLNILTGETGAGKSIIIGSVAIALGGKVPKDIIRKGAEYAYIELVFSVTEPEKLRVLRELDVRPAEDGTVIISKKIMPARSVGRVNDETVTAAKLREITGLLIDIHGQHEHQSLLYKSKHLEILDTYSRHISHDIKEKTARVYRDYTGLSEQLRGFCMDEEDRLREADFCRFEIGEIEAAALIEGEEEELAARYRLFSNAQKIMESLSAAREAVEGELTGLALKEVIAAAEYDERLEGVRDQLYDVDAILGEVRHEIASYMEEMTFDEEEFSRIEERLDLIRGLQSKYGGTVERVMKYLAEKKQKLEALENYDQLRQKTEKKFAETRDKLESLCGQLSVIRKKAAAKLTEHIKKSLEDLNFIDVEFTMEFKRLDHYTANGYDEAEFLISTNPGESVKPLGSVASGGELSRIMLAVKTVLADSDDIPTLIFDEIDAGISGRTAQRVSEKLKVIAKNHQVICITHLPQIAAMADTHFEIAKNAEGGRTATTIRPLAKEEMVEELARLLGGAEITDTVRENAREMKELAERSK